MLELIDFIGSHLNEIQEQTFEHLYLTTLAMVFATLLGVGLGIALTRNENSAGFVMGIVGVIQTIPSLALLGFLLPILGIGPTPAIVALFLYALLPIVRNTFTGIREIDPAIKESAIGMGMTSYQLLRYVELPIAFPVILAGIRTSTIINIGIATLCALIAAGGLGEFIFRGITLNNVNMILAGAIPASLLAIIIDSYLGFILKNIRNKKRTWVALSLPLVAILGFYAQSLTNTEPQPKLIAAFNAEFIERGDGYTGLHATYNLPVQIKEMEIGLMYKALNNEDVDIIEGFSTDGQIKAYDLTTLVDDKSYFPPYYAAPVVNEKALQRYPELEEALNALAFQINDELMSDFNYRIDHEKKSLKAVASELLQETLGLNTDPEAGLRGSGEIKIGSKTFTENYLLAHVFAQLIEAKTNLKTELKLGFGGTKLLFDALRLNEIDVYPEYTGTGFLVILEPDDVLKEEIIRDKDAVYAYVNQSFQEKYGLRWLKPIGFNNTFAIMMRKDHAKKLNLTSLSDLSRYLNDEGKTP